MGYYMIQVDVDSDDDDDGGNDDVDGDDDGDGDDGGKVLSLQCSEWREAVWCGALISPIGWQRKTH